MSTTSTSNASTILRLEQLQKLYDRLFSSGTTLSKLRDATIAERLYPRGTNHDSINIPGRSLAWKLFLAKEEPLQASLPPRSASLLQTLKESRALFKALLEEKTKPPDQRDVPTHVKRGPSGASSSQAGVDLNNPLSQHDENPWNEWFAGIELRKVISQDVERTFPEIAFFRENGVQAQLTNILFIYSVLHPAIGYRQGMHELLAPLYLSIHFDSISPDDEIDGRYKPLAEMCSSEHVAADAWALFDTIMNGVSRWYEWRDPSEVPNSPQPPWSPTSPTPNQSSYPRVRGSIQPYVAPIVQTCNHIQNELLQACDPVLWRALRDVGIEPQIYGIRWLRMLFTRELSMPDALKLWDGLFACDGSMDLAQWVCVAMLIRIRNELIPADYSSQLTTLLRFPSPDPSYKNPGVPHHGILLVRQALALQVSPTSSTGSTLIMENRTLLGIPLEVPDVQPPPPRRSRQPISPGLTSPDGGMGRGHIRQASSPAASVSEMFTRSIMERGESFGINKTLMNAVTELRRNIPEFAATLGGVRQSQQQAASFPLVDERPSEGRPSWEGRTRFDMDREVAQYRARDKALGESLAWIVDALLQDEGDSQDASSTRAKKRNALESLSYVRDVLMTNTMELEEERLVPVPVRVGAAGAEGRAVTPPPVVVPPAPVSVVDSPIRRSQHDTVREVPRTGTGFVRPVARGVVRGGGGGYQDPLGAMG